MWLLCHMCNCLEGGAGEAVRLLGGSGLGDLLPKGLRQAALQKLPARLELLVILGVLGGLEAALIEDGHHRGPPPSILFLALHGHFGAFGFTEG